MYQVNRHIFPSFHACVCNRKKTISGWFVLDLPVCFNKAAFFVGKGVGSVGVGIRVVNRGAAFIFSEFFLAVSDNRCILQAHTRWQRAVSSKAVLLSAAFAF
jgi:hypothetical protein